jgi:hypothetical protein
VLLHKGGGSTVRAENYRPVVLLNSLFQLVSCIIQERLVRIVEGSNILEAGQGGFRVRRSCDINMHKLDFITREAQKKTSNAFVQIDVDFQNAFNSEPHEHLFAVLRAFKIPDIDLLESVYAVATVSLAQERGKGGGVTFDTGVQQGSVLSPTLFNVFLNPLLRLLTVRGHQRGISHGIKGVLSSLKSAIVSLRISLSTFFVSVVSEALCRLLAPLVPYEQSTDATNMRGHRHTWPYLP